MNLFTLYKRQVDKGNVKSRVITCESPSNIGLYLEGGAYPSLCAAFCFPDSKRGLICCRADREFSSRRIAKPGLEIRTQTERERERETHRRPVVLSADSMITPIYGCYHVYSKVLKNKCAVEV